LDSSNVRPVVERSLTNAEIARKLKDIRTLMEFAGEPFFKFMAYERAAETLENAPPAATLPLEDLTALPGIGKTIAGRIREIAETGTSAYYEELAAQYPPTLLEVLGVSGIGMKTAQTLFREQGIASLGDLERAVDAGALSGVARLGKKSIDNIKRGILAFKGRQKRTPLGLALPLAREAIAYLEGGSPAADVTYAGSLRRQEPTVGDIDIVCTSDEPAAVIAHFTRWERAEAVLAEGPTKASIWLAGGLQIDLRVLPSAVYGNLLQHFTGSREHNIQLRELAVRRGLRVSENGILDVATGNNLTCRSEAEVYAALGLPFIAPEMRLGIGELEAALNGTLPVPIELGDLRGDFHMHCTWSDGVDPLEAMIAEAAARGYAYHSISDHSWGRGSLGLDPAKLALAARPRARARREARRADALLERGRHPARRLARFRGRRAGRTGHRGRERPRCHEHLARRDDGALDPRVREPVRHDHRPSHGATSTRFPGYEFDYDAVFAAAARTGTALEIDGQPNRLDLPSGLGPPRQTTRLSRWPSIATRTPRPISANVAYSVGQARRAWLTSADVLNAQPLEEVLARVNAKRSAAAL
jgi:DNA polymerase (family 10)